MESLANRYRPKTFGDLTGQPVNQLLLSQMVLRSKVPQVILLYGTWGVGKTTSARILAAAMNCPLRKEGSPEPCGACDSCEAIFEERSVSVLELDAASHGGVDDIRKLQSRLDQVHFGIQFVIIDESQSLTTNAQNALLKLIENPPERVHFVFVTTEPTSLLSTIKSRTMDFPFEKVPPRDILERLTHVCAKEGLIADTELLKRIAQGADGHLRDALKELDRMVGAGIHSLEEYRRLVQERDFAPSMIAHMSFGNRSEVNELLEQELMSHADYRLIQAELSSTLVDIITLKGGGSIKATGRRLDARTTLAGHLDLMKVLAGIKLMWDLKVKLHNDDPMTSIKLAVVLMTEELMGNEAPKKAVQDPHRVMTLEELRSFSLD